MSISPEDFGAVGDGVTDDAIAFRDMGVALRANPLSFQRIVFAENKTYLSNEQRWLSGVLNYEIQGNGSVWTSIDQALDTQVNNPFNSFDLSDPANISVAEQYYTGCKIQTTDAGRTQVVLTSEGLTDATAGFLRPGICLLHSQSQQSGGFPLNPSFYEWNEIVGIDLGSGVVTLSRPTTYSHRADNIQDYQSPGTPLEREGWGPARIASLEGSKVGGDYLYTRYASYKNVIFRMVTDRSYSIPSGLYVSYQDCIFDFTNSTWPGTASGPSMTKTFSFDRCRWIGPQNVEPDKIVGRFSMLNCDLPGIVQAAGVQQMEVVGCDFTGQGIGAAADHWLVDGCTFRTSLGQAIQQSGTYPGGGGVYKNSTSSVVSDPGDAGPAIVGNDVSFTFTVEEIGAGGELVWNYAGPQGKKPSHMLGAGGSVIFLEDGSNAGLVDHAIAYGANQGALIARLKTPAAVGDVFYAHAARAEVEDGAGNEIRFGPLVSKRISGSRYIGRYNKTTRYCHGIENVKVTKGFTQANDIKSVMRGWIYSVEIDVSKDYTGQVSSNENAIALFGKSPSLGLVEIVRVKTQSLGKRVISPCQTILQSQDILNEEALGYFWHNFHICGFTGFTDWPIETNEVYPIISVSIEVKGLEV